MAKVHWHGWGIIDGKHRGIAVITDEPFIGDGELLGVAVLDEPLDAVEKYMLANIPAVNERDIQCALVALKHGIPVRVPQRVYTHHKADMTYNELVGRLHLLSVHATPSHEYPYIVYSWEDIGLKFRNGAYRAIVNQNDMLFPLVVRPSAMTYFAEFDGELLSAIPRKFVNALREQDERLAREDEWREQARLDQLREECRRRGLLDE